MFCHNPLDTKVSSIAATNSSPYLRIAGLNFSRGQDRVTKQEDEHGRPDLLSQVRALADMVHEREPMKRIESELNSLSARHHELVGSHAQLVFIGRIASVIYFLQLERIGSVKSEAVTNTLRLIIDSLSNQID